MRHTSRRERDGGETRARRTAALPRVLMNIFFHSAAPWPTFQTEQRRRVLVGPIGEQPRFPIRSGS